MTPLLHRAHSHTRREFLARSSRFSLGAIALQSLLKHGANASAAPNPLAPKASPKPAKARAVIYLSMSGAPPQQDLFDYKPLLNKFNMQPCPEEYTKGEMFPFL